MTAKKLSLGACVLAFSAAANTSAMADENCGDISFKISHSPASHHITTNGAPEGGYNEDNNRFAFEANWHNELSNTFCLTSRLGVTSFENSYYTSSFGPFAAVDIDFPISRAHGLYGYVEGGVGLIHGYEGYVSKEIMLDSLVPMPLVGAGLRLKGNFLRPVESLSAGIELVPTEQITKLMGRKDGGDSVISAKIAINF